MADNCAQDGGLGLGLAFLVVVVVAGGVQNFHLEGDGKRNQQAASSQGSYNLGEAYWEGCYYYKACMASSAFAWDYLGMVEVGFGMVAYEMEEEEDS